MEAAIDGAEPDLDFVRLAVEPFAALPAKSIDYAVMAIHRLVNLGKVPLNLIKIKSGSYLGEDGIERFEDVYGRD